MTSSDNNVPPVILELDRLMQEQFELQDDLEARVATFEQQLCVAMGSEHERTEIRVNTPHGRAVVRHFHARVETIACAELSSPMAPFKIRDEWHLNYDDRDLGAWDEASRERAKRARLKLMPSRYWRHLASKADPAQQRAQASQQAAKHLAEMIGLYWGGRRNPDFRPPSNVRGCIEIDRFPLYPDTGFMKVTLRVTEAANKFAAAIGYALRDAGSDMQSIGSRMTHVLQGLGYSHEFQSRERFELGHGAHMIIFKKGTKLYLPQHVGEVMNLFISEHLPQLFEQAAA